MSSRLVRPTLCATFWKNRGGEAVRVELRAINESDCVDIRIWKTDHHGVMLPSKSGLCCHVSKLVPLIRALSAALRKAEELELL